jgi:hypothetical protein
MTMSDPATTESITVGVAIGDISTLPPTNAREEIRIESMLFEQLRFFGEKDDHIAHADCRHTDMNLFQRFALSEKRRSEHENT